MGWTARNGYLTNAEIEGNAVEVANYFTTQGWSRNAICATLGNMSGESGVNPGIWENLTPYGGGYGLTQWTPYTKLSDWATSQGLTWLNNGPTQCKRIDYESANNLQWFYNSEVGMAPPITFLQYSVSSLSIDTLTMYFLYFYEHPANPTGVLATRQAYANNWYQFLYGDLPDVVPPWLFFKFRQWKGMW